MSRTRRIFAGRAVSELRGTVRCLSRALIPLLAATPLFFACSGNPEPQQRQRITGPVPFKYTVIDPRPDSGKRCCADILAIGDLDNDGFSDVVLGSQGDPDAGLAWYRFPRWNKQVISAGEFTTDGKAGDIDGDGHLDIVSGEMEQGFSWFRNPGPGGSGQWARTVIDKGYVHDVEVADMDGDGDLDLVTSDKKKVVLWKQGPSNSWTPTRLLERKAEGLALSDINRDGHIDVVLGGIWLEAPGAQGSKWKTHTIAHHWPEDTRVEVVDMNADGRLDVVMTASEGPGRVSWFEQPESGPAEAWPEHPVTTQNLEGAHSLQVADMDLDGDLDIVTAEMHTSPGKRVVIFLQSEGQWTPFLISSRGGHNLQVADLDADGDFDIISKNYAGEGKRPLELWESLAANLRPGKQVDSLGAQDSPWKYLAVDAARPASEKGKMGLVFADTNRDGHQDIIAGSIIYRNPAAALDKQWQTVRLAENFDAHFSVDVDQDDHPDIIGFAGTDIVWYESEDLPGQQWRATRIGKAPPGRVQGYLAAQLEAGGAPELLFTKGSSLIYLRIPSGSGGGRPWDQVLLSSEVEESGVAAGDIDRDGDLDIGVVAADGHNAVWLENPSEPDGAWSAHHIGSSALWMDRLALTDINGDGRLDFLASEESREGYYKARVYWFEAPAEPRAGPWRRHSILTLRSVNSMDVADLDGDGMSEVVIAEHTDLRNGEWAPDNVTAILHNRRAGQAWELSKVEVDQHSSHLGARLVDLDKDGSPEIVSITWEQDCCVHLWTKTGRETKGISNGNETDETDASRR